MKSFEEKLTAWMDGELTSSEREEFERALEKHPEWLEEREAVKSIGEELRSLKTVEMPNPEFFNISLRQRLEEEMKQKAEQKHVEKGVGWWSLFSFPKLVTASAICLFLTLGMWMWWGTGPQNLVENTGEKEIFARTEILGAIPGENLYVTALPANDRDFVVLWVDGMSYLPADTLIR